MKLRITWWAAALALTASVAAQAQGYAGLSVGATEWKVDDEPGYTIDKSDTGWKVYGGWGFTPNFAVEGGYVSLGKAKFGGAATGDVKGKGWFVDLVGRMQFNEAWAGFAKIGAFNGKAKGTIAGLGSASDSGTDVTFGLGVSYALNKSTALRGEWERFRFKVFGDKGDVDMLSVGVTFGF